MTTINVAAPLAFGVGDGATTGFPLTDATQVVDSAAVSAIYRADSRGNNQLYANVPTLAPGSYPQYLTNNAICVRSTTATYIDANGVLQTAGVNVPRYQGGSLLVEAAATNLLPYSTDPSNAAWSGSCSATAAATTLGVQYYTIQKTTTVNSEDRASTLGAVSAGASLTMTLSLLAGTSDQADFGLLGVNSAGWGSAADANVTVLSGPGAVIAVPGVGSLHRVTGLSAAIPTIIALARVFSVSDSDAEFRLYPDTYVSIILGKNVLMGRPQVETGTAPTSYIPTLGAPVTRAADQISISDYAVSAGGLVTMAVPPAPGAVLTWTGSYEYHQSLVGQTLISQYANSPTIVRLMCNMSQYIDQTANFQAFYDYVWNVNTAQGFGLDIWGRIVGVGRILTIPANPPQIGFNNGPGVPFNQAPFNGGAPATQNYSLSDTAYRTLILAKALANISSATARSFNQLLQNLFSGRGRCYVVDTGAMTIRYVFEFALQPFEQSIVLNSGVFPRPAGVQGFAMQVNAPTSFAFNGGSGQPFGQGVFNSMSNLQPTV